MDDQRTRSKGSTGSRYRADQASSSASVTQHDGDIAGGSDGNEPVILNALQPDESGSDGDPDNSSKRTSGSAARHQLVILSRSSSDGDLLHDLPNRPDTTDDSPMPKRSKKAKGVTTELSKKELALRKKKSKKNPQMQRRDSLDLLDPEVDVIPGMTEAEATANRSGDWVIDPDSPFVTYWLAIVYMITVYNVVVIPFRMSFGLLNNTIGFWFLFDLFTDLFFIIDIYIHHHLGVYVKGRKVLNLKTIAARYRSNWGLPVDICASIPLDIIQIPAQKIVPAARLPRLLRAFHILELINSIENQPGVNIVYVRLIKLAMFTMFVNHFAACAWYASGYSLGSFESWTLSQSIETLTTIQQYTRAIYWAMSQMSGRGIDYPPAQTEYESLLVLFYIMISALFYIYVMAVAISLVESSNTTQSGFQTHVRYIMTFLRDQGLPIQLQQALQEYFSYVWQSERGNDARAVMQLLPSSIAQDIQMFLVKGIVVRCRMFSQIDQSALTAVVNMLIPRVCAPGEYIVHAGVLQPSMFFIQQGELEVLSTKYRKSGEPSIEQVISSLVTGDAFGEMQVFLEIPAPTSIRAKSFCQLYEFNRDHLKTLIDVYPADAQLLVKTAKQMRNLTDDDESMMTPSATGPRMKGPGTPTSNSGPTAVISAGPAGSGPGPGSSPNSTAAVTITGAGSSAAWIHDDNSAVKDDDDDLEKGLHTRASAPSARKVSDANTSQFASSRKSSNASRRSVLLLYTSGDQLPAQFLINWERCLIVVVLYNFVVIPIRAGILSGSDQNAWPYLLSDSIADIFLLADIALRYKYAAQFTDKPVSGKDQSNDLTKLARDRYLHRYLPIHALASCPIDWTLISIFRSGISMNLILRMLRFFRLGTAQEILFRNHRNLKSNARLMFMSTLLQFGLMSHILIILHMATYGSQSDSLLLHYTNSLILMINSLTGLGRTGLVPTTEPQMMTAILTYICGVWIMAMCIGSLAAYITERNSLEGRFSNNMIAALRFLDFCNAPEDIQTRTRVYFESMWSTMRGVIPEQALSTLPSSLRTKIMIQLCRNVIKNMPIFQGVSHRFIYDLVPNLDYEVFPAGEYIFRRGQMQNGKMYFVTRGVLSIILDETISTKPFKVIGTGSFFGECALLTSSQLRRASIRTETSCHLLSIIRPRLMQMFTLYPVFGDRMRAMAAQRVKRLDKTQQNMQQILHEVMSKIEESKLIANRTYNFIMYEACFVGNELVNWIITKGYADNREDAMAICIALLEKGMIRSVEHGGETDGQQTERFIDGLHFYRMGAYVDKMANNDLVLVHLSEMIHEDTDLITELSQRIVADRSFQMEANLISARALMHFLLNTNNVAPNPVEMAQAESRAEQLAQRLIDASILQNVNHYEHFENNDIDFYRLRALNPSDPQNSGPAASAVLLSGKTPAFSGTLLIRSTFVFLTYFGIISTGYPSTIYLYASKRSDRPVRILQTNSRNITVSRIEFGNADPKLNCIHLCVVEAPEKNMIVSTDKRCERDLVFCFDKQNTYQSLLEIMKAQGYTQKIRALLAMPWSTSKASPPIKS